MRLVTAVIQPHRLEAVKAELAGEGVAGMTVTEASGFGRQGSHTETYRGAEYEVDFIPKVKVEVLCRSEDADRIADAIAQVASSGGIGDGKIWTVPVDAAIRIRTGERGVDAI